MSARTKIVAVVFEPLASGPGNHSTAPLKFVTNPCLFVAEMNVTFVGIDDKGITVIIVTSDDDLNRINSVGRRSIGEREGVPYGAAANVCAPADVGGTDLEINPRAETGHVVRFHAFGHVDLERVGD